MKPDPLTDAELEILIAESLQGRQNARQRALRTDAIAARDGSEFCRESLTERHATRLRATSLQHSATVEEVRNAIDAIRAHHQRPQNGSMADAYHLLADIAERVTRPRPCLHTTRSDRGSPSRPANC